jgi:hypothetical protein
MIRRVRTGVNAVTFPCHQGKQHIVCPACARHVDRCAAVGRPVRCLAQVAGPTFPLWRMPCLSGDMRDRTGLAAPHETVRPSTDRGP